MTTEKSSTERKKNIVSLYYNGKSVEEITQQYGVPRSTFYRWVKKYAEPERCKEYSPPEQIRELLDTIAALEEENQLLRRAIAIIAKH